MHLFLHLNVFNPQREKSIMGVSLWEVVCHIIIILHNILVSNWDPYFSYICIYSIIFKGIVASITMFFCIYCMLFVCYWGVILFHLLCSFCLSWRWNLWLAVSSHERGWHICIFHLVLCCSNFISHKIMLSLATKFGFLSIFFSVLLLFVLSMLIGHEWKYSLKSTLTSKLRGHLQHKSMKHTEIDFLQSLEKWEAKHFIQPYALMYASL